MNKSRSSFGFGFELKKHQIEGIEWLIHGYKENVSRYLADEPGLGKTIQICRAFSNLPQEPDWGKRALFVVPRSVLYWWEDQLSDVCAYAAPEYSIQVIGETKVRRVHKWSWFKADGIDDNVKKIGITTYGCIRQDIELLKGCKIPFIVFDEAHRLIGRNTKTTKACKSIVVQSKAYVWMVSGTPVSKGPEDIWSNLNILDRSLFSSYWKFLQTWFVVENSGYQGSREILGVKPQNQDNFRLALKPYILRREKYNTDMPSKTRAALPVEMGARQAKAYKALEKDMIAVLTNPDSGLAEYLVVQNALEKVIRMRQLLICPSFVNPSLGLGASLEAIIDQAADEGPHFAIFCPFPSMFGEIGKHLHTAGLPQPIYLTGKTKAEDVPYLIHAARTDKRPVLISIRYAEGFSVSSISRGYFLGCEYVPKYNIQAEDRIHRLDSPADVRILYMINKGTIEEDIQDILNDRTSKIEALFGGDDMSITSLQELVRRIKARSYN